MILVTYTDYENAIEAEAMPFGGALCGRGVDGILFDAQDFDKIVEGLTSESANHKAVTIDYLTSLITRFGPGKQSHRALLR